MVDQRIAERLSPALDRKIRHAQRIERTECFVYQRLAQVIKEPTNSQVLRQIAEDENRHAAFWASLVGEDVGYNSIKAWIYVLMTRIFGLSFALKLMERGERRASSLYRQLGSIIPEALQISAEEDFHEQQLLGLLSERWLRYVGSIVLGLSDALVELTGTLAGLTLALRNGKLIALAGLVTGLAAAMSMASSEYLSTKAEDDPQRRPALAALYTGITYLATVLFLILPYLIVDQYVLALGWTLFHAALIISVFTFYTAVAQDKPFWSRLFEMATISFGVAAVSFGMGAALRCLLGVEG